MKYEPISEIISTLAKTCEEDAEEYGWDYKFTQEDCDFIVDFIRRKTGRMPSKKDWLDAGFTYIGNRHYED